MCARKKREIYAVDQDILDKARGTDRYAFAVTLNKLLEDKGISQGQLHEMTQVSTGAISKYRTAQADAGLTNIIAIAKALNVDCHYLMTGTAAADAVINYNIGLTGYSVEWLRNAAETDRAYLDFINSLFSDYAFQQLVRQLYDFRCAVLAACTRLDIARAAAAEIDRREDCAFMNDDDLDEAFSREFRRKLEKMENDKKTPQSILRFVRAQDALNNLPTEYIDTLCNCFDLTRLSPMKMYRNASSETLNAILDALSAKYTTSLKEK